MKKFRKSHSLRQAVRCSSAILVFFFSFFNTNCLGTTWHSDNNLSIATSNYIALTTTRLYVDIDANGNNDGTSWGNAFTDLQDALAAVNGSPTEIWVAMGTYKPTNGTDRSISFVMQNDLAIYGGFDGTETTLAQRDWSANETILSGDIGTLGDDLDNSYSVVRNTGNNLNSTAILDGFTIKKGRTIGNGTAGFPASSGAGIYINNSSPTISNCKIIQNVARSGSGIFIKNSSSIIQNCQITNNSLFNAGTAGAGLQVDLNTTANFINCTITNNTNPGSNIQIENNPAVTFTNCIIRGPQSNGNTSNASFNNCILSPGLTCNNCPNGDGIVSPLFTNAANGDYTLQECSPAIDAGLNSANTATLDLAGNDRIYNVGTIDIGAYEYQANVTIISCYADTDNDTFGDANTSISACLTCPSGYVANSTDCNDNDASINETQLYYVDADGDGYGSTTTAMLCSNTAPSGYATNSTDCNDNDASINETQLYYVDADGDGYGSTTTAMLCSSTAPSGYATNSTDCNDNDASVHEPQLYYIDTDGDGYGSTTTAMLCSSTAPSGYATNSTDCNDNDASVHEPQLYYIDTDGDGYGSTATAMLCSSTAPSGYATNSTDCNDNDVSVHEPQLYYIDTDGDGYGSTTTAMLCSSTAPSGYALNNTDCDDTNSAVNPNAVEICGNSIDDNCDGNIDEGCSTYCDGYGQSTQYEWIDKVKFAGIDNTSGDNGGYADFTHLSASVDAGSTYPIQLKPGYAQGAYWEYWCVWIDFNQDNDWEDAGELVFYKFKPGTVNGNIHIPNSAIGGITQMRVSMTYNGWADPCDVFAEGEVEDYSVDITPNNSAYCNSNGQSTQYEWIKKVRLGNINNNSGNDGGYGDYTNLSTTLSQGQSKVIVLKPGFAGNSYREYWRVWVDWNQDGDFDDAGEKEVQENGYGNIWDNISVPNNALVGTTRMRVSMKYGGYAGACDEFSEGEVEDYTIQVVGSQALISSDFDELTSNQKDDKEATSINQLPSIEKGIVNDMLQKPVKVKVYPNPAQSKVNIQVSDIGDKPVTVLIFNQLGKLMYETQTKNPILEIGLSDSRFVNGVYLISVQQAGRIITKRLVIAK